MQIATCLVNGKERLVRKDEMQLTLLDTDGNDTLRHLLAQGRLETLHTMSGRPIEADELTFLPPVLDPEKILCVGLNYRGHAAETGNALPEYPPVFVRFPGAQVGHGQAVIAPSISGEFDYEAELAFIVGRPAYRVKAADAMEYVAGYTCFAENSVRDFQMHSRQATAGKNFNASGAIGPWLTTADEISDVRNLEIIGRLNGNIVQHDTLANLVFDIPQLIEYMTSFMTLVPGDIIATGTPDGVGFLRDPKIWLHAGDVFEVDIPGVGLLSNPVVGESV